MKKAKLTIEMIPKTCWASNVRSTVSATEWDKIRFISYAFAKNKCQICKNTGKKQGYRHDLECHEIWDYDEVNKIQKLTGLISLCPLCHFTTHFGRATAMKRQALAMKQLELVNGWDHKDIVTYLAKVYEEYKERSKYQWTLDLSILEAEPFNIKIKKTATRKFKKPTWKKKRRKTKKRR